MGDMLSQAEIDALLKGASDDLNDTSDTNEAAKSPLLTPDEIDALGEVGNIGMGTSATTLFTLLGQRVSITTPKVKVTTWKEMATEYKKPYVAVKVEYVQGIIGTNLLILNEDDVKIITNLMMGGDGTISEDEQLTEMHLSAIGEAMNQMMGSAATSMSSMFSRRIDISPPEAFNITFNSDLPYKIFGSEENIVRISFRMEIGNLIDSEIMQIIPIGFAKDMVAALFESQGGIDPGRQSSSSKPVSQEQRPSPGNPAYGTQTSVSGNTGHHQRLPDYSSNVQNVQNYYGSDYNEPVFDNTAARKPPVNVQPARFQSFDDEKVSAEKESISLLMDVPLQITVELGRTQKLIREILEFGPGTTIELDKLAGEPVDILVNGKKIAKGEVVVIDESFGVRIADIVHPSKRI